MTSVMKTNMTTMIKTNATIINCDIDNVTMIIVTKTNMITKMN
jgi:hypothetical protein